jgi:hypothetical protein
MPVSLRQPVSLRLKGGTSDGELYHAEWSRAIFEVRRFERPGEESIPTVTRAFYRFTDEKDAEGHNIAYHIEGV